MLLSKCPEKKKKQLAASHRLETFFAQTFWNNNAAWVVQMCMICLALAGRNIDRAWWTIGPGGVGQSLKSCLIANLFGHSHHYMDMNVFYDDSEIRKQGENMAGSSVFTGQEAITTAKQKMREDLYKKLLSADPIAVRLPYAIVTKMVELTGWKRFELNMLISFGGVTESNFDSIMRRSCVASLKGKFVSPGKMSQLGSLKHCAFERHLSP